MFLFARVRSCPRGFLHIDPENFMSLHLTIGPLLALIAGILILIMPRLLNFIVALYFILIGIIGLFGLGSLHLH